MRIISESLLTDVRNADANGRKEICRCGMTREELVNEIQRVEVAINKTNSRKLRTDYTKYLRKMRRELNYYDRNMEQWQMSKI